MLLRITNKEKITLLGISAKYIDTLRKLKPNLNYKYKLQKLRTICSTGSPLSNDGFNYIYNKIKKDVHLASISGGTENACHDGGGRHPLNQQYQDTGGRNPLNPIGQLIADWLWNR